MPLYVITLGPSLSDNINKVIKIIKYFGTHKMKIGLQYFDSLNDNINGDHIKRCTQQQKITILTTKKYITVNN